jgi:hypothetical protein
MCVYAQEVKVYGVITAGGKPLKGVLIVVFENDSFYKRLITDHKGQYRFKMEDLNHTIFYYKPGYETSLAQIINKLDAGLQMIPINIDMKGTLATPDSVLKRSGMMDSMEPAVARILVSQIYRYEQGRKAQSSDPSANTTKNVLIKHALEERKRFANYKKEITLRKDSVGQSKVVSTTIGTDKYELVTSTMGEKRYYKNDRPITEMTYLFETTRRYDDILKNKRDVRKFEKYDPQQKARKK